MRFHRSGLGTCPEAEGLVVAVDVIRAFTTAAVAFASGALEILPTGTVEDAFALRGRFPEALLVGEVDALPIPGFDFDNSPSQMAEADLTGKRLIQRTTAGTQGLVRARRAKVLLVGSFACAEATARHIRRLAPESVTFILTGLGPDDVGDEDAACADYLEALIRGRGPDPAAYLNRVRSAPGARKFLDPGRPEFSAADLEHCLAADRFDFAMAAVREEDLLILRPVTVPRRPAGPDPGPPPGSPGGGFSP